MVLEDHVRKKRRLIPPLLAAMGNNYSPYSWANQLVPELFWITLLIDALGLKRGVEIARQLGQTASQVSESEPKPLFAPLSSFLTLRNEEKETVKHSLPQDTLDCLRDVLAPLEAIWPNNPLTFLGLESSSEAGDALAQLGPVLEAMYNRHSREATLAITTAVHMGLEQGRIQIDKQIYENRKSAFADIENYPETEESKSAGAFFRAMAPMFLLNEDTQEEDKSLNWVDLFWIKVSELGECIGRYQDIPELPDTSKGISGFVHAFSHFAQKDVRARQQAWNLDLNKAQIQQVVLALIARQATLAIEIVSSPGTWNPNVAPILLRAMADVHITLVWLLGDVEERVPMYVSDGLGAIKLELAHRKAEAGTISEEAKTAHAAYTKYLENWLDSQCIEFLTEVNLGSWSGKNTRVMADESGCIDFYNYVFQPFSSAVHSYWSHVGRINVEYCENPSHNFHFLPIMPSFDPDLHWCHLAAKYLAKSLDAFDEFLERNDLPVESYAVVIDAIEQAKGTGEQEA